MNWAGVFGFPVRWILTGFKGRKVVSGSMRGITRFISSDAKHAVKNSPEIVRWPGILCICVHRIQERLNARIFPEGKAGFRVTIAVIDSRASLLL